MVQKSYCSYFSFFISSRISEQHYHHHYYQQHSCRRNLCITLNTSYYCPLTVQTSILIINIIFYNRHYIRIYSIKMSSNRNFSCHDIRYTRVKNISFIILGQIHSWPLIHTVLHYTRDYEERCMDLRVFSFYELYNILYFLDDIMLLTCESRTIYYLAHFFVICIQKTPSKTRYTQCILKTRSLIDNINVSISVT